MLENYQTPLCHCRRPVFHSPADCSRVRRFLVSRRFLSVLLPQLEHITFLVNRFPILMSHGDFGIQGFIADAAEWRLAEKIQDYWHWAASEKGRMMTAGLG
jgi:hypothetical protein